MVGKWLVVLPLLVYFNHVMSQPITQESRQLHANTCCPCPDPMKASPGVSFQDRFNDDFISGNCPCHPLSDDAEPSGSILQSALRAMEPFVKKSDKKLDPKPLLQPEVGLASSVLETLRQATDEEYQEALARDAARSTVKLIESTLDTSDDTLDENPKNKVRLFLNTGDEMDDNLPESSHIQETRCIHSPLTNIHKSEQLRMNRPTPMIEVFDLKRKPPRKLKSKNFLHKSHQNKDNVNGGSNIQEHVIQPDYNLEKGYLEPNPALLSLFTHNILEENVSDEFSLSQKHKPNIHLKLREFINNLEVISKNEKTKTPVINLKEYISSINRNPPLKLNPVEKPKILKDLLKLKDVELVPPKSTKNIAGEILRYPNFKLRSDSSRVTFYNPYSNIRDNSNLEPVMNNDIKRTLKPSYPSIADTEISPTNLNHVFKSKDTDIDRSIVQNLIPIECMTNSENSNMSFNSLKPENFEGSNNFYYDDFKPEEDKVQFIFDNFKEPNRNDLMPQLSNNEKEYENKGFTNNNLRKEQAQELVGSEDNNHELSNTQDYQIELLEDLETQIKFDNSSFISKSCLNNDDNIQYTTTKNENIFNDPIVDTSNNDLHIGIDSNGSPNISEMGFKKDIYDCNSREFFSIKYNFMPEQQSLMEKSRASSEDDKSLFVNSGPHSFLDKNDDRSQVSFKDLQEMSNSILRLSECEPPPPSVNTNNLNESLDQTYDDYDISNAALSIPVFETNSKITENSAKIKSNLSANSNLNEVSDKNPEDKLCKSSISAETISNVNDAGNRKSVTSSLENIEMRGEASEPKLKLYDPMSSLFRNTDENSKNSKHSTTVTADLNDMVKKDFLYNLKSKLEGLFSTTDKPITSDVLNSPDDNVNDSSNIKPVMATFGKFKNSDNLQRTPQTLLHDILAPIQSATALDSYKNKLPIPHYIDKSISEVPNNFNFPSQVSRPFLGALDPSLSFTTLSDRLRSHTETAMHNIKETLESTLKDSQNLGVNKPTDTIDTHDILESISNRRDQLKDKLEAINFDLNDRFSSFQQSIVDHFNVSPDKKFKFQDSNGRLSGSEVPVKKQILLPEKSNSFLRHRVSDPIDEKKTQINLISSKIPTVSDAARFWNSDGEQMLQNTLLYSTTTAIPSFVLRPKILKTKIDSSPKIPGAKLANSRPFKMTNLSEEKVTKFKPLTKEYYSSTSSPFIMTKPAKSLKTNIENIDMKDESVDSPVNNFRKTLLERNQNQKSRNRYKDTYHNLGTSNSMHYNSHAKQKSVLNHLPQGRPKNSDEQVVSSTSHVGTIRPSESGSELRLVEPMKENVPYKCKLICYKDS